MGLISTVADRSATKSVIFVHGLEGDRDKTWRSAELSWPEHLSEQRAWNVLSIGYSAAIAGWRADMPFIDRARQLLEALSVHEGLRGTSMALVTHSLGGLLAKQMVRHAAENKEAHGWFLDNLAGTVFVATPHTGSNLASYVSALGVLVGAGQAIKDLQRNASYLSDLNQWYRNNHAALGLRALVFYETKPTKMGLFSAGQVVEASAADPGIAGVNPIPLDDDHSSAAKPNSQDALQLVSTLRFLDEVFELPPRLARLPRQAAAVCYRIGTQGAVEFLLILTDKKRWTFPKGHIEPGESIQEAATREAEEEAGVRGEIDKAPLPTYLHSKKPSEMKTYTKEFAVTPFLLKVTSQPSSGEAGRQPTWFGAAEARARVAQGRSGKYAAEIERVIDEACRTLATRPPLP